VSQAPPVALESGFVCEDAIIDLCSVGDASADSLRMVHHGDPSEELRHWDNNGEREMCPWAISKYFGD
jgi:hypothetical protein